MWIQEWVDNQFGVPNTVNIQVYEDFAKEVEKRMLNIVMGEIDLAYLIRANGGDITGMNVLSQLKDRLGQALKGESNGT